MLLAWTAIYFGVGVLALQRIEHDGTAHAVEEHDETTVHRRTKTGKAQHGAAAVVELPPTGTAQGKGGEAGVVAVALPPQPAASTESKAEAAEAATAAAALATVDEGEEMKQEQLAAPAKQSSFGLVAPAQSSSGESAGGGHIFGIGGSPFPSFDLEAGASTRLGFAREKTTMGLPFTPTTLAFRNLTYTVKLPSGEPIDLLHGVSGYAKPGTLTALMGSSGAGKTTLLDVRVRMYLLRAGGI